MEYAPFAPVALDFEAIRETSDQFQILTSKLPGDAVHSLAIEVVNRLSDSFAASETKLQYVSSEMIERLCDALVSADALAGVRLISDLRADGMTVSDIYLFYLAAAARRLGEKWNSDDLGFADVAIGTSRILAIMHNLRSFLQTKRPNVDRMAIFSTVPDEQHTIGISMASDLFRREGWEIALLVGLAHEEILSEIAESEALVVGLTAHGTQSLGALVRLIAGIRITNPAVYILISGHIVQEAKDVVALTGADGFAPDIPSALIEAKRMFDLAHH